MEKPECVLDYKNGNLAMSDDKCNDCPYLYGCKFMAAKTMAKLFEQQTNALIYNLRPDVIEKRKRDSEFVQNCPDVEWEREMGYSVPVCSIDGQYCNRQCRRQ